jgi:hypothetical protein
MDYVSIFAYYHYIVFLILQNLAFGKSSFYAYGESDGMEWGMDI